MVSATTQLGFPESSIVGIGIILLISVGLHLLPRTSCLGALLITAYLGGAVASKVRIGAPVFDIIFALIVAILLWGGFWLRDPSVREILPVRRPANCSYFPFSGSTLKTLARDLTRYERTKSSLHFPTDEPLSGALVRELIKTRIAETE